MNPTAEGELFSQPFCADTVVMPAAKEEGCADHTSPGSNSKAHRYVMSRRAGKLCVVGYVITKLL